MGERLLCKQEVIGSIPVTSTTLRAYALRVARHPKRVRAKGGGGERNRTDDLLLAKQALSQLSYTPGSGIGRQESERTLI